MVRVCLRFLVLLGLFLVACVAVAIVFTSARGGVNKFASARESVNKFASGSARESVTKFSSGSARGGVNKFSSARESVTKFASARRGASGDLCVLGIFKNEAMGIREWVEHYKAQGVQRIFLLNDGSTDAWRTQIGDDPCVVVKDAPERHAQSIHYNSMLPAIREYTWCLVVDMDEFVYGRKRDERLLEFVLAQPANVGQVSLPWKLFGSSGHTTQPPSIRKGFLWRKKDFDSNVKSLVRTANVRRLNLHTHATSGRTITETERLALNHYAIQSKEFFEKVKMARGDANAPQSEHVRNWAYFARYDHKGVLDTELADMT